MKIVKRQMMLHHAVSIIGGFMAGYTICNHTDLLANAQTGNLIHLVVSACHGDLAGIGWCLLLFVIYAAGNVFYVLCRRVSRLSMKIVSLGVTALSVAAVSVLSLTGLPYLAVAPLAFAMPVQWNAFKIAGGNSSATIFSSNNVRQTFMLLTNYFLDRKQKDLRNARFYAATLLCFHLGVAAGCLSGMAFAAQGIWCCLLFVALAAVAYYRYESAKIRAFQGEA
ncbi:MAG: DUF1275 domain-containing protein [Ruminococcus sp.]|nr:DUF1275 domain-containing protein [Ruminococcus sp.]